MPSPRSSRLRCPAGPGSTLYRPQPISRSPFRIALPCALQAGHFLSIVNSGTGSPGLTELGTDAHVGSVLSVPSVTLRDRAKVDGNIQSGGTVTRQNQTIVSGTVTANSPPAFDRWSWTVDFPPPGENLSVGPDGAAAPPPGPMGDVTVFSRSTLRLRTGTYYLSSLALEPQAQVAVDTTRGPVVVYVRAGLTWRGGVTFNGPSNRFLVAYSGTNALALESPFTGTVIAPGASLRLAVGGATHTGAFFAKNLQLDPDVQVKFQPFVNWPDLPVVRDNLCAPATPGIGAQTLTIHVPRGLRGADVAVQAEARLTLQTGSQILQYQGGFAPVSSTGQGPTSLGNTVATGHLFSSANASVGTGSVIHGSARSAGSITFAAGARATETVRTSTELTPFGAESVAYTRPSARANGLAASSTAVTASPSLNYGPSNVSYGGVLKLTAGDFHFDSLTVARGGLISVDNTAGPVRVFIYGAFNFAGVIREALADKANVLFVQTSCNDVTLEGPFRGTLLAPAASIRLKPVAAGHTGAFFGASVIVEPGTIVRHHAFKRSDCAQADDGCGSTLGCSATKLCAPPTALASVTPIAECVLARGDGTFVARFGYNNAASATVSISPGAQNKLSTGTQFQSQVFEPGRHEGAFYVKLSNSLTWTLGTKQASLSTSSSRCQGVVEGLDRPIRVVGSHDNESGASTPGTQAHAPLDFQVPPRLAVSLGGAGNGTATLKYRDLTAGLVTCTYRGGSRVATAVKDFDRARGRFYDFVSCTNGAAKGSTATGSEWTVNVVSGDPTYSQTNVTAEVGPGCSALDAPIPADISVKTRESFSWKTTQALADTDPNGLPALYYMWIYVERREQVEALKRMRIYHRTLPIFGSQLAAYSGKCGTIDTSGDGTGIFVHALVPGAVFNLWRTTSLVVLNRGAGTIPFRVAQVLPAPEPALMNSDGLSLSWTKIKASGLIPFGEQTATQAPLFGIHVPIVDDVIEATEDLVDGSVDYVAGVPIIGDAITGAVHVGDNIIDTAISIAPSFDEIVEASVDLIEIVEGLVTNSLGEFESWIFDTVPMHLDLTVLNRDAAFNTDSPMIRAWGSEGGRELPLTGVRAEIHKWGNLLLPTTYHNTVSDDGQVNIEVAKGGSARGQSGLCISLQNDAAMMASGITENEFCDFRDIEYNWDFDNGNIRELRVNDWQLHAFNQINDAYRYAKKVLDFTPRQAEVGVGFAANLIAKGNADQPLTACLNFPEGKELLVEMSAALGIAPGGPAVGAVGLLAAPIIERDMFLPDTAEPRDSRGIVTHEYGHFIMCDILHNIDRNALLRLFRDRIPEGKADSRDDDVTVQSEAFADFIMTQVAGGGNYSRFAADRLSNFSSYCLVPPCVETNFRGQSEVPSIVSFNDEARRFTSLLHDVVDRKADLSRSDNSLPTNADLWSTGPGSTNLSYSSLGYLMDTDDAIELPGTAVDEWWDNALEGCRDDLGDPSTTCNIDPIRMQHGLARTMMDRDATWCDTCSLIMAHSRLPEATSATTLQATWHACADTSEGQDILGPPPTDDLRLDAATCKPCDPGTVSDPSGQCVACSANEVVEANKCVACPPGSIVDASLKCAPCGPNEISVGNTCKACEFYQTRSRNSCFDCSPDLTIDWSALAPACPELVSLPIATGGAGDTCPDAFWVEITHIDDALKRAKTSGTTLEDFKIFIEEPGATKKPTCESAFTTVAALLGSPGNWTSIGGKDGFAVWTEGVCQGRICTQPSTCTPPAKLVPGSEVISGQQSMRVFGRAQQRNASGQLIPAVGTLWVVPELGATGYKGCHAD